MRLILPLLLLILAVSVVAIRACLQCNIRVRQWQTRAEHAEQTNTEAIRLLRAAGSEVRELALGLLGRPELAAGQPTGAPTDLGAIVAQLSLIADDLQDHAPPTPESRVLKREMIEVAPLLSHCIAAIAASLGPTARAWKLAPELADLRIYGDQRALSQVLLRVLSNAARATRHLDWIEIGAEFTDGGVMITVQDEGTGLLAAAASSGRDNRGFGLGLAVARSLVRAHGGSLEVESVAGVGARVEVSLPALARQD
jgi:signal transduction histidine kinase